MTSTPRLPLLRLCAVAALSSLSCVPERIAGQADADAAVEVSDAGPDADVAAPDALADGTVAGDVPDGVVAPDTVDGVVADVASEVAPLDVHIDTAEEPDALPTPSGPCDFVGLDGPGVPLASPVTAAVGGFRVEIDVHRLRVEHLEAPDETVLSTPFTGGMFHASTGALEVGGPSSGYAVTHAAGSACKAPRFTFVAHGLGRAVATGVFEDGGACDGASFRLRVCEPGPQDLRVELQLTGADLLTTTLRLEADPLERMAGLGVQLPVHGLNLRGQVIPVVSRPDGLGRGLSPLSEAVEASSPGASGSAQSAPYAAPILLTSQHRALLLEGSDVSVFDLTPNTRFDVEVAAPDVALHLLRGATPAELVERITALTGRPEPPPSWVNGGAIVGLAGDPVQSLGVVDALRDNGALIAGVWTAAWTGAVDWPTAPARAAAWKPWTAALAERGVRLLCVASPLLRALPPDAPAGSHDLRGEAVAAGHVVLNADGNPYLLPKGTSGVLVDLSDEGARAWMRGVLAEDLGAGARCSGWSAPGGEVLPFDAALASGEPAGPWHGRYAVEWARLQGEALAQAGVADGFTMVAAGHARTAGATSSVWAASQLTSWAAEDGLPTAMRGLLEAGLSGVPLAHTETGGSQSGAPYGEPTPRTPELLMRWTELSAFTGLLRTHPGDAADTNAQVWSTDEAMAHFARMTRVYAALAFYREQLAVQAASTGLPVVRPLLLEHPDDPESWDVDDELMLGPDILVAPTLAPCPTGCPTARTVYLPPGVWTHLWTGAVFGVMEHGTTVTVDAPPGRPAVFTRFASAVGTSLLQNLALLDVEL